MRIIIYGAGAVGCVIAGLLARVGQQVVLIGRTGHMHAVKEKGLHLVTPASAYVVELPVATSIDEISSEPDDVIFLCVKGQDTETAISELEKIGRDLPIFCMQNGIRNEEIASRYFSKVYGVVLRMAAVYVKEGEVSVLMDPPGNLIIGSYPCGADSLIDKVAGKLCDAGFLTETVRDVMSYKWGKLIINLSNIVAAITDTTGNEIDAITDAAREELRNLLDEARIVYTLEHEPTAKERTSMMHSNFTNKYKVLTSTWQSFARETGSVETEFLNGEVVRLAERLGRKAPINEALVGISREMVSSKAKPGKYSPLELGRLLGLETKVQG